jgi:hypothetical protein
MVKRAGAGSVILVTAIALASCGGSDNEGPAAAGFYGPYKGIPTGAQVVDCLKTKGRQAGFTVSEAPADLDPIARKASDRAVAVNAGGVKSLVIIERTEAEAHAVPDEYKAGPGSENGGGWTQTGTIVIADKTGYLKGAQLRAVTECTKYGTKT